MKPNHFSSSLKPAPGSSYLSSGQTEVQPRARALFKNG